MQKVDIAVTIAPKEATITDLFKDLEFFQDSIDIIELRIDQWTNLNEIAIEKVVEDLQSLKLNKFRNYLSQNIEFNENINIFY